MFIEPVGDDHKVVADIGPTVSLSRLGDQFTGNASFLQLVDDDFGLLIRDQLVRVAVDDQGWGIILRHVIHRTDVLADLKNPIFIGDRNKGFDVFVEFVKVERGAISPGLP